MKVEILYTAWNRLEFTRASFELLKRNTGWNHVSRLVVYDDGSEDGTREYLEQAGHDIGVPGYEVREGGWHSTGATMNDYVARLGMDSPEPEAFVKIDNDICLPPGWLPRLLGAAHRFPDYELIGMEAGWTGPQQPQLPRERYGVTKSRHIGGVGLMRSRSFLHRKPIPLALGKNGRAGFTIWQHRFHLRAGWLTPDLPVVQLDRIPAEPWRTLSERYIELGWARAWDPYTSDMEGWWSWLPEDLLSYSTTNPPSTSSPT